MKALWAIGIEKKTDPKMLLNYITLGQVQNVKEKKETFFENIYSLPPAHHLSFYPFEERLSILSYWDLNREKETVYKEEDAIEKFTALFNESVKKRLRSDVPIGTSLSGGLDSSTIIATSSKLKATNDCIKTFSAVFPGFDQDESKHITQITNNFNVENLLNF